jgi:hypothetical protein
MSNATLRPIWMSLKTGLEKEIGTDRILGSARTLAVEGGELANGDFLYV